MSYWTHITACIYLETDIQDKNIKEVVEEILKKAPQITGSEGNANIFVNPLSGHNMYVGCDCHHCPFGHTLRYLEGGGFSCKAPKEYTCKGEDFQTSVAVTIIGDLRDRFREQTKEEYSAFISYLKSRFYGIRLRSCNITGTYERGLSKQSEDNYDKGENV